MNRNVFSFLLFVALVFFSSCDYFSKASVYESETEDVIELLHDGDYEEVMANMAWESEAFQNTSEEDLKSGMMALSEVLRKNFDGDIELSFMDAKEGDGVNLPAHATLITYELSDGRNLGVLDVIFDDSSGKMITISLRNVKEPKLSMSFFWLFGLLTLCVPAFNLYVIYLIKKSSVKRKWLKYLAVIFLNVPSLVYMPIGGFSLELLSFQMLLGISVHYVNYFGAAWAVGGPLGGAYWFWKLKFQKNASVSELLE